MRYAIWAVILISAPLYATPSISVVTDTNNVVQGGTLTISGTGFTSYSTTTGTFDQFETGGFASYWASHNALLIGTANQRNTFSTYNATHTFTSSSNDDAGLQGGGTTSRSWYVSYWWYVGSNWVWGSGTYGSSPTEWLSNIKMIRFWNTSGTATENVYLAFTGYNGSLYFLQEGHGEPIVALHVGPAKLTKATWHEFRFQFVDSSAPGVHDGSAKIFFDTMTIYNVTGQMYKTTEAANKRPQRVGFQNEWGCNDGTVNTTPCTPGDYYQDNVYVADTIARVEICDQPVYTNCQEFPEIQRINSWTGTDINITYNGGSLTSGTTHYVFVVDNAGVASDGFPLVGPGGGSGGGGGGGSSTPHTGINGKSFVSGNAIIR